MSSAAGVSVAAVWVSIREAEHRYMDPIKLRGLLALHAKQLESATNLTVLPEEAAGVRGRDSHHHQPATSLIDPPSAAYQASTSLPLQVVDTNSTSLVTPRLTRTVDCRNHEPQTCTATSCLNGGRCLAGNRCMCPGGSWGPRCKILSRTFSGKDWAWVRPLPPCLPLTLSLRVLTRHSHALLFYSGPMTQLPRHLNDPPTPMLALQVNHGRPQVLVEGGAGSVRLEVPKDVSDGLWHTLHLKFSNKGVALVVDVSEPVQGNISITEGHSVVRASWSSPGELSPWPLQIGGLAHARPHSGDHGWRDEPTSWSLEGCISHLRLNGQLVDLGEPAYSHGGQKGCQIQQAACPESCGHRGQCVGGLDDPECECEAGWQGPGCNTPTLPVTLASSSSYIKLALTFSPTPQMVLMQLRLRTRSTGSGVLLTLTDARREAILTLHLRSGLACASGGGGGSGGGQGKRTMCVESRPLGDGAWHTLKAELHPYTDNLVVAVDDGDGWHRNQSLLSLANLGNAKYKEGSMQDDQPVPLKTDEKYRVIVGALPDSDEATISKTCVDDVRVSGRSVPLPPASNSSRWGEVSSWQGVGPGCEAPDACLNTTCVTPLTCINTWGRATCSCGTGRQLMGQACRDVDECLWQPCLHGGTCHNLRPGYQCVCGPGHVGDHCQWPDLASAAHPLTAPLAITALVLSIIMLVVMGVLVSVRLRRQGEARTQRNNQAVTKIKATESENIEGDGDHRALIEGLKVKLPQGQLPAIGKGPCLEHPSRSASHSPATEIGTTRTLPKNIRAKTGPGTRARLKSGHDLLPAQDDLRAYAYEGDGSSSGSLSSALSGLREEPPEDPCIKALAPGFSEVMDLLKNLPDAAKSSSALAPLVTDQPGSKQQQHPSVTAAGAELTTPPQNTRIYTIIETDVNKCVSKPPADRVSSLPYHDEETTAC